MIEEEFGDDPRVLPLKRKRGMLTICQEYRR